jgi:hypothetical protein
MAPEPFRRLFYWKLLVDEFAADRACVALCDMSYNAISKRCILESGSYRSLCVMGLLVLLLGTCACMRRDGRNSDCRWPAENPKHRADARHLSAGAEFAEDLAIRYADTHYGRHSANPSEAYGAERDRCMEALFAEAAKEHGVAPKQVATSLGCNRAYIDLAMSVPFILLYCFAAAVLARAVWNRYPPVEDGWTPGAVMTLFLSLVVAAGSTLLGEQWNWFAETHRIGNGHMSYRADRLWWGRHRLELFVGAVVVFLIFGFVAGRRGSKKAPEVG